MTRKPTIHVFIGYDERQDIAYRVCKHSLIVNNKDDNYSLVIHPLRHRTLRDINLFDRAWTITSRGSSIDNTDNRPFSTNFAFTRFLVPHYADYLGINKEDPCVFVDSDFVFTKSISRLFTHDIFFDNYPLWVVKHDYNPGTLTKMDNQVQSPYNRKLWSSFMVFNRAVTYATWPTLAQINKETGTFLHQLRWIDDDEIGAIPESWNFIPNHSEKRIESSDVCAIHYTEGSPIMVPGCRHSEVFNSYLRSFLLDAAKRVDIEKAFD